MSDYWDRRAAETMWEYMEDAEETAKAIARLYRQGCSYLTWEMREIYERFRDKHGLTDTEARQLLTQVRPDDLDGIRSALQAAADQTEKAKLLAKLETPAYQYRINRLQDILDQVDGIMTSVYRRERAIAQEAYRNLAEKAYYRRIFQTQKQTGLGFSFSHVSASEIDQLVKTKWYGANYSERIWNNTQALAEQLKEELTVNFLTGRTNREAAEAIGFRFGTGIQKARRLVRTESTYLANQMEMKSYEESGIERYRFVAVLDLRTSEICRSLDGKVFPVSEQQPGKNCPPMHPYCRSTTTCELSEEELAKLKRRARNPKTGKTETVPANMTYEQWYEKYVKGDPEAELNEIIIKNKSSDKKQYEQYREILGKDAPETLEEFQRMKYNETEKWSSLKKKKVIFSEIQGKDWTDEFKDKAKKSYRKFEKEGFSLSSHALSRLPRLNKKGFKEIQEKDLIKTLKGTPNYRESEEKVAYFSAQLQLALIQNSNTKDIVTIVRTKKPKEVWESV